MRSFSELKRKSGAMSTSSGLLLGLALLSMVVAVRLVECQEQLNIESRQQKDGGDDIDDTFKFIERLNKIYSQARPRFGRSGLQLDLDRRQMGGRWPLVGLQRASGHYESPSALMEMLASARPPAAAKYRDY